jgi:hypothetical protein
MKKITVVYSVYHFKELSREAKDRAIKDWYEDEDYPFLEDNLTESCKGLLEQHKITGGPTLGYSLSYSQGDGLNFTGSFQWRGYSVNISHSWRYPFASASEITLYDKGDEELISASARIDPELDKSKEGKKLNQFIKIYLDICRQLEKEGYGILEYRMDDKEFAEHCKSNGYNFFKNGKMANL